MPNDNIKSYLHLHVIVFIWGFTAILGDLISIEEIGLVWYRMTLAGIFMLLFVLWKKKGISLSIKEMSQLLAVGLLIALHWILFFKAINVSNVSITLAIFSTGAFMGSILEPIFFNRKLLLYEVLFGLVIVGGLFLIMQVETQYITGALYALVSVFLGVIFTLFNGKLIKRHDPAVITVYEFFAGAFFVTLYLLFTQQFSVAFFQLSVKDLGLILVLASVCTAYAFTASVKVMRKLSPYTVMLTTNMEPVYGILLAFFMLGEKEKMTPEFYIGAVVVLITVILNGVIKNYKDKKEIINASQL